MASGVKGEARKKAANKIHQTQKDFIISLSQGQGLTSENTKTYNEEDGNRIAVTEVRAGFGGKGKGGATWSPPEGEQIDDDLCQRSYKDK